MEYADESAGAWKSVRIKENEKKDREENLAGTSYVEESKGDLRSVNGGFGECSDHPQTPLDACGVGCLSV